MHDFEENAELWALGIPGRDTREAELGMVPDVIKENLSREGLEKYMHMGVLAYAASSYLMDIIDELKHIETYKGREELRTLCFNRVAGDLHLGADAVVYKDEESENWARSIAHIFDDLSLATRGCE